VPTGSEGDSLLIDLKKNERKFYVDAGNVISSNGLVELHGKGIKGRHHASLNRWENERYYLERGSIWKGLKII